MASCRLALSVVLAWHHLEPASASMGTLVGGGLLITEEIIDILLLTLSWSCIFFFYLAFRASASPALENSSPVSCHLGAVKTSHRLYYCMGITLGWSRSALLALKRSRVAAREMSL